VTHLQRHVMMISASATAAACWLVSATTFAASPTAGPGDAIAHEAAGHGGAHAAHDGITLFNWPSAEDPRIGLGYLIINFLVLDFTTLQLQHIKVRFLDVLNMLYSCNHLCKPSLDSFPDCKQAGCKS